MHAYSAPTTGAADGVLAETENIGGRGVYGIASAATGVGIGVRGDTAGDASARGVFGRASSPTGTTYGVRGDSFSTGGRGVFGFAQASSGTVYGVLGSTNSSSGFGVFSNGDLGATGVKAFHQPHPSDPTKEVRFVCLEGNESGTYFRGSAMLSGGLAVVEVPEDFRLVTATEGLTVQVTPMGPGSVWVEEKSLERIVIRGTADVELDYFVNGVRRGFADLPTIVENHAFRPAVRGVPFGTQLPAELRQMLVDTGILNPDLTPNEALAAELGWTLEEPELPGADAAEHAARSAARQRLHAAAEGLERAEAAARERAARATRD